MKHYPLVVTNESILRLNPRDIQIKELIHRVMQLIENVEVNLNEPLDPKNE